jgi:hypothetical protein
MSIDCGLEVLDARVYAPGALRGEAEDRVDFSGVGNHRRVAVDLAKLPDPHDLIEQAADV